MKTVILMRHAKSSWDAHDMDDFDRPLNGRGYKNAPQLGHWIAAKAKPDLVLCSSAKRAKETFEHLGLEIPVLYLNELYLASAGKIVRVLQRHCDSASCVLVIAHNPGIGQAADTLLYASPDDERFLKYPTAATTIIDFNVNEWTGIGFGKGVMRAFTYPKALPENHE